MKETYFDIQSPENNVVYDYDWRETQSDKNKLQKRLKPSALYKIIPFAFGTHGSYEAQQSSAAIREIVKDFLKDKNNLPYLAVRCTYSETYKRQQLVSYPNNRNNVLNALIARRPVGLTKKDLTFMKDIFTKAIAQGVSPLEKSMSRGYTPLASFLSFNYLPIDQEVDFLKFLIELHPESLTDFSEKSRTPILHILVEDRPPFNEEDAEDIAQLVDLIVAHLPSKALKSNLNCLQKFYKNCKTLEVKEKFDNALQHLAVKIEKAQLENNIITSISLDKKDKIDASFKKSFKI